MCLSGTMAGTVNMETRRAYSGEIYYVLPRKKDGKE